MNTRRNVLCTAAMATVLAAATSYAAEPAPETPMPETQYARPTVSLLAGFGPQYGWLGGAAFVSIPDPTQRMWGKVFGVKEYAAQAVLTPHVGVGTAGSGLTAAAVGLTWAHHYPCGAMWGFDATYGTVAVYQGTRDWDTGVLPPKKLQNGTSYQAVLGWTWDVGITAQISAGQSKCSDTDVCGPGFNVSAGVGYVF